MPYPSSRFVIVCKLGSFEFSEWYCVYPARLTTLTGVFRSLLLMVSVPVSNPPPPGLFGSDVSS